MSKRYGRQQKRKAKSEIERLSMELKANNGAISKAALIIDVARSVNPNSICFEPKRISDNNYRHAIRNINDIGFCASTASEPCKMESIRVVDLNRLESNLINSDFDRSVHFHVRIGMKEFGYSISNEGLRDVPIEFLANEIAKSFK